MASHSSRRAFSAPLVIAAALLAAGVGDPLVERLGNAGLFGPGYRDVTQAGAVPAIACALLVVAQIAALRALRGGRDVVSGFSSRRPGREAVAAFVLQLLFVYAIEGGEAVFAGGKAPGTLSWLGAPPLVALAIYAVLALVMTLAVAALARVLTASFTALIRVAIAVVRLRGARDGAAAHVVLRRAPLRARSGSFVRRTGERGPPLLALSL